MSLFDEDEPDVKPKKKRNARPGGNAANAAIKRCIDAYHQAFVVRFGFKPQIHGGKDGAIMKALLALWGEADVMALIEEFLTTTDPRVVRSDYTLGALTNLAQHLKLRGQQPQDARTVDNLDAASRAMRRKGA